MSNSPNFRAQCAELLAAIQLYTGLSPAASEMSSAEKTEKLMDAMAATRTALEATLPPEPPTVMEIIELSTVIDDAELGIVEFTRAALERWGHV